MRNRRPSWIASAVLAALTTTLASCGKVPVAEPLAIQTIAVLPFDNESNDLNAPDIMQRLVYLALKNSRYQIVDRALVESTLTKANIVDGGQLGAVDPVKLAPDLGAQALLYGDVTSFTYTNVGFYLQRKVAIELKLVDGKTGQTLWEGDGSGVKRQVNLNKADAGSAFLTGLGSQALDKAFKSPLEEEATASTVDALKSLPGYRFAGFAADDQTPSALKSGGKNILKGALGGRSR